MPILNEFSAANVTLDATAKNKRALLELLAAEAADRLGTSSQEILDALQAREELGSTALGKGAALPHAQLPGDFSPLLFLARLRRPLDFEASDGEPVDLAFLILWPASDPKGLLNAMADICRELRDTGFLRRLRGAGTAEEIAQLIRTHATPGEAQRSGSAE